MAEKEPDAIMVQQRTTELKASRTMWITECLNVCPGAGTLAALGKEMKGREKRTAAGSAVQDPRQFFSSC